MEKALICKFSQHEELSNLLLNTGNYRIVQVESSIICKLFSADLMSGFTQRFILGNWKGWKGGESVRCAVDGDTIHLKGAGNGVSWCKSSYHPNYSDH